MTVTFDLNGGEILDDDGNKKNGQWEIENVYVGASDYFGIPTFKDNNVVNNGKLYDWRIITTENPRGVKQDNVVNDLTTSKVRYTVPSVDTTYQARWIVQSMLSYFNDSPSDAISIPSGKIELQGSADSNNLTNLRQTLAKAPVGKEFELDFSEITSSDEKVPLVQSMCQKGVWMLIGRLPVGKIM